MKISICTVTARRGFVELQARMIANQDNRDIEWVLVDFAFEERRRELEILSSEQLLKIVHVPNVRNKQRLFRDIARNRNKALKHATGDAVIFLDDYAVIPTNFVSEHLKLLKDNCLSAGQMHRLERPTDYEVLQQLPYGWESLIYSKPPFKEKFFDKLGRDHRNRNDKMYKSTGMTYTGNLGIPRVVFEHLNGFDPRMESALEDCDFGIRAHIAKFSTFFNPDAFTINLNTSGFPYVYSFGHTHDVEPFISNPNNNFAGDAKLKENDKMRVEFHENYRIAICKVCGARGMIDPNELTAHNLENKIHAVPKGLPGGFDDNSL